MKQRELASELEARKIKGKKKKKMPASADIGIDARREFSER